MTNLWTYIGNLPCADKQKLVGCLGGGFLVWTTLDRVIEEWICLSDDLEAVMQRDRRDLVWSCVEVIDDEFWF